MWETILAPGRLTLLNGARRELRAFHIALIQHVVTQSDRSVLLADGDHGFNPYHLAEANLAAGLEADFAADRVLIKRAMTPFQWDSTLTGLIEDKLCEVDAGLVLAAPYDRLFSTDELQDWEQEDYVRYSIRHLKGVAERHKVPILLSVDMQRWWKTHPVLAQITYEGAGARWFVENLGGAWRVTDEKDRRVIAEPRPWVTLEDFIAKEEEVALVPRGRPRRRHLVV